MRMAIVTKEVVLKTIKINMVWKENNILQPSAFYIPDLAINVQSIPKPEMSLGQKWVLIVEHAHAKLGIVLESRNFFSFNIRFSKLVVFWTCCSYAHSDIQRMIPMHKNFTWKINYYLRPHNTHTMCSLYSSEASKTALSQVSLPPFNWLISNCQYLKKKFKIIHISFS